MRKQITAARSFPTQRAAERRILNREQQQIELACTMASSTLDYLIARRQMNEAVTTVLIATLIALTAGARIAPVLFLR